MTRMLTLAVVGCLLANGCSREPIADQERTSPALVTPPAPRPEAPTTSSPTREIFKVGGDVTEPVEISRVEPIIPDSLRTNRVLGSIVMQAVIEGDGTVSGVRSMRPVPAEASACMAVVTRALSQWRYRPAMRGGKPVAVELTVLIHHSPC